MNEPASTDEPLVLRNDDGPICTLVLNRPAQYNALSGEMLEQLDDAQRAIAADETIRVVVLTAAGKAFCPGHDLKQMREQDHADAHRALFTRCSQVMQAITRLPQPVIARVQGMATAAGCQLVASCDLAIAADDVRFAVSGISIGLFCSTPGVALSRNVHRKHAMEMLLTGEFIDAHTAERYGLVNHAVPRDQLDAEVARIAGLVAARPPAAVQLGKALFYRQLDQPLAEAYPMATEVMVENLGHADTREGIDAFIGKRKPRWS